MRRLIPPTRSLRWETSETCGRCLSCFRFLREQEPNVIIWSGMLEPDAFDRAAVSLGQLKSREAVPNLLRHLCHEDVVSALEAIGDPAAIPDLKEIPARDRPR